MSEDYFLAQKINNNNTVCVYVYGLVRDYELSSILIFKNIHVHIIDAQFVLKVQNEHVLFCGLLCVLHDVELVNFDQVGTQLTTSFVC